MSSTNFKRLNRQMIVYRVVQTTLIGLLIILSIAFQAHFSTINRPDLFIRTLIFAFVGQLLLFWPLNKLACRDVRVEIEGSMPELSIEQLRSIRKKRLIGDLWKFCGVAFFLVFITLAPDAKKASGAMPILAITLFSFILTCLMYFQCFNYDAKKQIRTLMLKL